MTNVKRLALSLILSLLATSVHALEIQDVRWGFDGQVLPERFNVLSVLVANPSSAPFDDALSLYKTQGTATRVGAIEEQPCYLAPFSARWVQFYPYLDQEGLEWVLSWGRTQWRVQPQPRFGPPATVLLTESDPLAMRQSS